MYLYMLISDFDVYLACEGFTCKETRLITFDVNRLVSKYSVQVHSTICADVSVPFLYFDYYGGESRSDFCF